MHAFNSSKPSLAHAFIELQDPRKTLHRSEIIIIPHFHLSPSLSLNLAPMAPRIPISILLVISSLLFTQTLSKSGSIDWWCNQTPHPHPCKTFAADHYNHRHRPLKHQTEFRKLVLQVALDRAQLAHKHVLAFKPSCETKRQRSAWQDCHGLYDDTILQLNRTLDGLLRSNCTAFDAQTWLSSALTNIHTCQAGSKELNVSSFISPLNQFNVSEMISNGLAVNAHLLGNDTKSISEQSQTFPNWVTRKERRLLASTSLASRANIVVAKDGSSRYSTVQSAINVAARRTSTSSKYIIYVKRGIYKENIDVPNNVNNVVMVGDGMKNTIITSGRSVKGGYTTYNSATAGTNSICAAYAQFLTYRILSTSHMLTYITHLNSQHVVDIANFPVCTTSLQFQTS